MARVSLSVALLLCAAAVGGLGPVGGRNGGAPTTLLLVDTVVDATATNMTRAAGQAVKGPGRVLAAEHPWEEALFFFHSVVPNTAANQTWLYYGTWTALGAYVCLAVSSDYGATFSKPNRGVVAFNGSTANNIVLQLTKPGEKLRTVGAVFLDPRAAATPGGPPGFKMTVEHAGNTGMDIYTSHDGVAWELLLPQALPGYFADTQPVVFFDPRLGEYQAYGRLHSHTPRPCPAAPAAMRQVGWTRTTGGNLSRFGPVEEVLGFESLPECVDVYNSAAVQAHNAYLMLPSMFYHFAPAFSHAAVNTNDGVLDIRMAVSGNGVNFSFVDDGTFVRRGVGALDPASTGPAWHYNGDWDSGILFAVRGYVETASQLVLFYWGSQTTHGCYPSMFKYGGAEAGIGRLTLRRDGWFSFDAPASGALGVLTTLPVTVPTGTTRLLLNIDSSVRGWVHASVLDAAGRPIPGLGLGDCALLKGNYLRAPVIFGGNATRTAQLLGKLSGQQVILRLHATLARVFSVTWDQ